MDFDQLLFEAHRKLNNRSTDDVKFQTCALNSNVCDVYSRKMDIIHLLHDITHFAQETSDPFTVKSVFDKIQQQMRIVSMEASYCDNNDDIVMDHTYLTNFVIETVRRIVHSFFYGHKAFNVQFKPNWMTLLYHRSFYDNNNNINTNPTDIFNKLSVLSPLLPLFDINKYDDYMTPFHDDKAALQSLIFIRQQIPFTPLKGVDHNEIENNKNKNKNINNNNNSNNDDKSTDIYWIDYSQLFGKHLSSYILSDICKYITSFLDISSFFKCSLINHCWLNLIFRNYTFSVIYKNIQSEKQQFSLVLLDHVFRTQVQRSPFISKVGWTIQCSKNKYLDFMTLQELWFQEYVRTTHITLQKKKFCNKSDVTSDNGLDFDDDGDLQLSPSPTSKSLKLLQKYFKYQSMCVDGEDDDSKDVDELCTAVEYDADNDAKTEEEMVVKWVTVKHEKVATSLSAFDCLECNDIDFDGKCMYRVKMEIMSPFISTPMYSQEIALDPVQWQLRYNEAGAKDDEVDKHKYENTNERKLFYAHQYWLRFYLDLMHTLNTNYTSECLKNVKICLQRTKSDKKFVKTTFSSSVIDDLIRFLLHSDDNIKYNAMKILRVVCIHDQEIDRDYFLNMFAEKDLVSITQKILMDNREEIENKNVVQMREQMLWFLGYFIKSGVKWKSIVLQKRNAQQFIDFMTDEIDRKRTPADVSNYMWAMSKLFSLYHQTREDDEKCDNIKILNSSFGKKLIVSMIETIKSTYAFYKELKIRTSVGPTDGDEKETEAVETVIRDACMLYSMSLRYFHNDFMEIIDDTLLGTLVSDLDQLGCYAIKANDEPFMGYIRITMSNCIDEVFRLQVFNETILKKLGYYHKMCNLLDTMVDKFEMLLSDNECMGMPLEKEKMVKNLNFLSLFPPILEAIPVIAKHLTALISSDELKRSLIEILGKTIEIECLRTKYVDCNGHINWTEKEKMEQSQTEQETISCIIALIWDFLQRYPVEIRQYVSGNGDIMKLISSKWATHESVVTADQAVSLHKTLTDDNNFNLLFMNDNGMENANDDNVTHVILCPCGDELQLKKAKDCYPPSSYSYLYCDYCRLKVDWGTNPMKLVYHCDKKEQHKHGFDLCVKCARTKKMLVSNH